jgi:hypothetical protein
LLLDYRKDSKAGSPLKALFRTENHSIKDIIHQRFVDFLRPGALLLAPAGPMMIGSVYRTCYGLRQVTKI